MKKSLLALGLALGIATMTFAATQDQPPTKNETTKKKKKGKNSKKAPKKTDGSTGK